jgi:vacuolar-type H+-ATPase subunit E/Vma4
MKPEEENIELLSRAILKEAQVDAGEIQAEAAEKAEAIRQRAKQQAEAERREILERAAKEAERLRSQVVATAQLKARTSQLEHREKLLDQAFKGALDKLTALQKRPDYDKIAAHLLREALSELNAREAIVRADAVTQKVLKDKTLAEVAKEMNSKLSLGETLDSGTGLIVDTADGHLHYDNTLETRLRRLQSALRSSVYQVLMGERL